MIKKTLNFFWRNLNRLRKFIHAILLLSFLSIILALLSPKYPNIYENSILMIDPKGKLVDQLPGDPFDRAVNEFFGEMGNETLVQDIIDALDHAKNDERIKIIYLNLNELDYGGLSKLERIRIALGDFKESGKTVVAFAEFYNRSSYYLASSAQQVYLHPEGVIFPEGFSFYSNYYNDLINKLKVNWNIFRAGSFKTAVEPFMRNDMSIESKDSRLRVAKILWKKYESDITETKSISDNALTRFSEDLLNNIEKERTNIAQIALNSNLIDGLVTEDQLSKDLMRKISIEEDEYADHLIDLDGYLANVRSSKKLHEDENNIGIIVASGEILDGKHAPGSIGDESISLLLKQAKEDESIKALVLKIDTPGGSAFASEKILNELLQFQSTGKPIVVSMGSVAASGGYWIAMAADKIFASEATITGSIGVFAMFPTFQDSFAEIGIYSDGLGTNQWSGSFRLDREMTPQLKRLVQSQVEYGYNEFIEKVSKHRDMIRVDVEEIAKGQIWTGSEAVNNGLIDAIGGMDESVKEAAKLANLDEGTYGTVFIENPVGPMKLLTQSSLEALSALGINDGINKKKSNSITLIDRYLKEIISPVMRFNDPKGIYAYCFCELY